MIEKIKILEEKLKRIERYLDTHPEIPLEVVINIKNIIYNDKNEE